MTDIKLDIESIRDEYAKAMRAWHVVWIARPEWHQLHFHALEERSQALVYDYVIQEREQLRAAEEKAFDRFLAARGVFAEALRTVGEE